MRIRGEIIFERETGDVLARFSGLVTKHFGSLEVLRFESDLILTPEEREMAEVKLMENAALEGFIPELEPDARRR